MIKSKYILQAVSRSLFGLLLFLALVFISQSQTLVLGKDKSPEWDKSSLYVKASCEGTSCYEVNATVCNGKDSEAMLDATNYEVWYATTGNPKDGDVVFTGTLGPLASGECTTLTYNPNGTVGNYMFKVYQAEGHPGQGVLWSDSCAIIECIAPTATPIPPTPTEIPNDDPTPTTKLDPTPTEIPNDDPTPTTKPEPTVTPTSVPTVTPTPGPTSTPTPGPTTTPEPGPTATPGPGPTATPAPAVGGFSEPTILGTSTVASNTESNVNPLITGIQKSRGKVLGIKTKKLPTTGNNNGLTLEKTPSGNALLVNQTLSIPKLNFTHELYQPTILLGEFLVGDKEVLRSGNLFYGHNDQDVFGRLNELSLNDEIIVNTAGEQKAYHVTEIKFIPETEISILNNTEGISLLTCVENNPQMRLLIIAK